MDAHIYGLAQIEVTLAMDAMPSFLFTYGGNYIFQILVNAFKLNIYPIVIALNFMDFTFTLVFGVVKILR